MKALLYKQMTSRGYMIYRNLNRNMKSRLCYAKPIIGH